MEYLSWSAKKRWACVHLILCCWYVFSHLECQLPVTNILVGIKSVTAYSHPDSVYLVHCTYKIAVGDLASWWHLRRFDEENHVVATGFLMWFVKLAKSYGSSANFICKWFQPDGLVFTCQECVDCLRLPSDWVEEISSNSSVMLGGVE